MAAIYQELNALEDKVKTLSYIKNKAKLYSLIRDFFAKRKVMEVTTPTLRPFTVTDRYIESLTTQLHKKTYYLQSSPEYAMKQLLALGSGCIYQICQAFRADDFGRLHKPEFTMLEWYRINFDHLDLIAETDELFQNVLKCKPGKIISYKELFLQYLDLNPLTITKTKLIEVLDKENIKFYNNHDALNIDDLLNIVFTYRIEPQLTGEHPWFVYNYPRSQAALAKLNDDNQTAARFEVFYQGIELANGYFEEQDSARLRARFNEDNTYRKDNKLPLIEVDEPFLQITQQLPSCSGIALGIDRLMLFYK